MLIEFYDPVAKKNIGIHTAPFLYGAWKELSKKIVDKNSDRVYTVVGMERSGKSTWTFQQAKIIDHNFSMESICFTPQQFLERIKIAPPGSVVVFDEAFRGFSSKSSQSKINKALVQAMMEVGRRNLVIFIVLPSFNYLEHYIAVHRSRGLFQIYEKTSKKYRAWKFFNRKTQPKIYHMGKKNYGIFPKIKTRHTGKFFAHKATLSNGKKVGLPYETFDYDAYEEKKVSAFGEEPQKEERGEDWRAKSIEDRALWNKLVLPITSQKQIAEQLGMNYKNYLQWKSNALKELKKLNNIPLNEEEQALEDGGGKESDGKESEIDGKSQENGVFLPKSQIYQH